MAKKTVETPSLKIVYLPVIIAVTVHTLDDDAIEAASNVLGELFKQIPVKVNGEPVIANVGDFPDLSVAAADESEEATEAEAGDDEPEAESEETPADEEATEAESEETPADEEAAAEDDFEPAEEIVEEAPPAKAAPKAPAKPVAAVKTGAGQVPAKAAAPKAGTTAKAAPAKAAPTPAAKAAPAKAAPAKAAVPAKKK